MTRNTTLLLLAAAFLAAAPFLDVVAQDDKGAFSPWVDAKGNITVPEDPRLNFAHLGSYVITDKTSESFGFHDVYTRPESIRHYRKTGEWPDRAVLIKELRKLKTEKMTTAKAVSSATDLVGWFVMIKDAKGRFKDNPHWDAGWGWGLYYVADPKKNVSEGFNRSCKGCHIPAKLDDWVYVDGYPALSK